MSIGGAVATYKTRLTKYWPVRGGFSYTIGVDPGKHTGIACFGESGKLDLVMSVKWSSDLLTDVDHFMGFFSPWVRSQSIVGIECPSALQSNAGVAASNTGALVELAFCTGAIAAVLSSHVHAVHNVPINWKGNLPKRLVKTRLERTLEAQEARLATNEHERDAVGVALWMLGIKI